MLYISASSHGPIPTLPTLTEDQAIDIMKADIERRVGDASMISIYAKDSRDPTYRGEPLPLIYYRQEDATAFRINETSHTIMASCIPSVECFLGNRQDVLDSINGRLTYFIEGSHGTEEKRSPAAYYVDAMSGDILWSYIGEDISPELEGN